MHVTVEDGRAVAVAGDPDHPITVGFLCGKVSNYLERVYSEERILHPLVRAGAKGDGRFERVSWDEALDRVAGGLARAREEFGGESILPYSLHGHAGADPEQRHERARDERARRQRARAHDLRERRDGRHA